VCFGCELTARAGPVHTSHVGAPRKPNSIAVRVKPGARRTTVGGRWDGRLGVALVVAVTAPAVDGRANEAVCRALAEALNVPRRDITVVTGARSRDKLIDITTAPPDLSARLRALTGEASAPDE
jgi:uncharacterized protein